MLVKAILTEYLKNTQHTGKKLQKSGIVSVRDIFCQTMRLNTLKTDMCVNCATCKRLNFCLIYQTVQRGAE